MAKATWQDLTIAEHVHTARSVEEETPEIPHYCATIEADPFINR
jgi:hypothetical protein